MVKAVVVLVLLFSLSAVPPTRAATPQVGTLTILHEDRLDGTGRWRYFVVPDGSPGAQARIAPSGPGILGAIEVATPRFTVQTGDRVEILQGRRLLPAPDATTGLRTTRPLARQEAALLDTVGAQRALLILATFSDQPPATYPLDGWREFLGGDVAAFFAANSYGRASLTFDLAGSFVVPLLSVGCPTGSLSFYADQAAIASGVDLTVYHKIVYFFPQVPSCHHSGLATIGGTPGRAWLNGSAGAIMLHELGHTYGLWHSHACPPQIAGQPCQFAEYGDTTDVMGGSTGHFNPHQKTFLRWLDAAGAPPILTVTRSGDYDLERYETLGAGGLKALRIPRGTTGTMFYVKRNCDVDAQCGTRGSDATAPGVSLYLSDGNPTGSYLIDTTPETPEYTLDSKLTVGRTYVDAASDVAITLLSGDAQTARVRVVLQGMPPPPPPPPAPVVTGLVLLGHSPPGREMTFRGTYTVVGATLTRPVLTATLDAQPIAARYVVIDPVRKTWSAKVTGVVKGIHTFALTAGSGVTVAETFTVR